MTQITTKSAAYVAARGKLGDHRKVFDSVEDALASLRAIYALEVFPNDFPVVAAGVGLVDIGADSEVPPLSDWPAAFTAAGTRVCVSFLGVRGLKDEDGNVLNGARGFVVYPLFPVDALRGDESGEAWLWKVVEKEASHVALRNLRNVNAALGNDALAQAAMDMPQTVSEYVEESTRESLDTSAFDGLWKQFRTMLGNSPATAALVANLPSKSEVLKAIRSETYAKQEYAALEEMGAFVFMANTMADIIDSMKEAAVAAGEDFELDSGEIRGWLATRATKVFASPKKIEADLSTVNFAAFMQSGE